MPIKKLFLNKDRYTCIGNLETCCLVQVFPTELTCTWWTCPRDTPEVSPLLHRHLQWPQRRERASTCKSWSIFGIFESSRYYFGGSLAIKQRKVVLFGNFYQMTIKLHWSCCFYIKILLIIPKLPSEQKILKNFENNDFANWVPTRS